MKGQQIAPSSLCITMAIWHSEVFELGVTFDLAIQLLGICTELLVYLCFSEWSDNSGLVRLCYVMCSFYKWEKAGYKIIPFVLCGIVPL